ncbi:DUF4190 domain-containing protein [Kutzneria buriramensis]|uniref:Putative regulator of septum formation n=1 Tax=Kutzneria buriramensis TaxID=1045776 RepID=A0A3E0HV18_9PSEU|nr:DUF4190 domain-containing protein [Kutzneria buriramensis]REH50294.1 putative regulator of septum formation [Kutzneria buriramensis]
MSTEHEQQPAYQNYPAMPPAQPAPWSPGMPPSYGMPAGPYGMPPSPYGMRPGVNGFAIASLVLGILAPFSGLVLGLVFGIIALVGIRRTGERGRGMAITGIVLSSLWILLVVAIVVFAVIAAATDPTRTSSSGANTSYNFKPGQCFDRDNTSKAVTVRDCGQPHDAEVFAVEPLSATSFPGTAAVQAVGRSRCTADSDQFLTPGMNYPDIEVLYLYPQQASWTHGDRSVKCYFANATGAKMTGHVKDTGVPYNADQKRYLDAVAPYNKIVDEEENAETFAEEHDVAVRSVPVVQQEIAALQAGPWPAAVQPSVDKLVAAKQQELADRQRAAAATDEDSLDDALDDADSHDGSVEAKAVRTALHLPAG